MPTTYQGSADLTTQSNQFLKIYAPGAFDIYDASTPALGFLRKTFNHVGSDFNVTINLSFGGGRGFGSLPTPSNWLSERVSFARKKAYYRARIDREALMASKDGGAVRELFRQIATVGPRAFAGMIEYALFAPYATNGSNQVVGSGKLGTLTAVSGSNPYTCTLGNDFKAANFEVGDIVHVETGNSDLFEVQGVDPDNSQVTLFRTSGTQVPLATDEIFLENSEDLAILGYKSMTDFTSGDTLYGVSHQYRFAPGAYVNGSSGDLEDHILDAILEIGETTGEAPDKGYISRNRWSGLAQAMDVDKRYNVAGPMRDIKGHFGFKGIEFVHPYGVTMLHLSRYQETDEVELINTRRQELKHARGFGWFRDSGSIFLTRPDDDELEVRYGGYPELFSIPTYHGQIHSLP